MHNTLHLCQTYSLAKSRHMTKLQVKVMGKETTLDRRIARPHCPWSWLLRWEQFMGTKQSNIVVPSAKNYSHPSHMLIPSLTSAQSQAPTPS